MTTTPMAMDVDIFEDDNDDTKALVDMEEDLEIESDTGEDAPYDAAAAADAAVEAALHAAFVATEGAQNLDTVSIQYRPSQRISETNIPGKTALLPDGTSDKLKLPIECDVYPVDENLNTNGSVENNVDLSSDDHPYNRPTQNRFATYIAPDGTTTSCKVLDIVRNTPEHDLATRAFVYLKSLGNLPSPPAIMTVNFEGERFIFSFKTLTPGSSREVSLIPVPNVDHSVSMYIFNNTPITVNIPCAHGGVCKPAIVAPSSTKTTLDLPDVIVIEDSEDEDNVVGIQDDDRANGMTTNDVDDGTNDKGLFDDDRSANDIGIQDDDMKYMGIHDNDDRVFNNEIEMMFSVLDELMVDYKYDDDESRNDNNSQNIASFGDNHDTSDGDTPVIKSQPSIEKESLDIDEIFIKDELPVKEEWQNNSNPNDDGSIYQEVTVYENCPIPIGETVRFAPADSTSSVDGVSEIVVTPSLNDNSRPFLYDRLIEILNNAFVLFDYKQHMSKINVFIDDLSFAGSFPEVAGISIVAATISSQEIQNINMNVDRNIYPYGLTADGRKVILLNKTINITKIKGWKTKCLLVPLELLQETL